MATARPAVIDGDRLWHDLMELARITEPDRPYTRRSFTPMFAAGREFLKRTMTAAGLAVRIDAGGNLIGRLEGSDPHLPTIAIGSHSDTVSAGGRFDGVAGVVAALEVARAFATSGERLRHSIEVVDCLAEEPSEFGLSCIGSRAMTGKLDAAMLAMTDLDGRTLDQALREVGGDPDALGNARRDDLKAFLELHIEQGPVLEAGGVPIGVVTAIVGIRRVELLFEGQAAHAGTAPMDRRRDAAYAAALVIVAIREKAEQIAAKSGAYFVATVGIVDVWPGGSNVVPGRCRLVVDVRSSDSTVTANFTDELQAICAAAAARADVAFAGCSVLSDGIPAACDPALRTAIRDTAREFGLDAIDIASGAGHDTAFLAAICPTAMVFIPCLRGMSHTPDEYCKPEELAAGTAILLGVVRRIDAGT